MAPSAEIRFNIFVGPVLTWESLSFSDVIRIFPFDIKRSLCELRDYSKPSHFVYRSRCLKVCYTVVSVLPQDSDTGAKQGVLL
jgi:hypothetical protein